MKLKNNGWRKKPKIKRIKYCFLCHKKLNGSKNEHHHPPSAFEEWDHSRLPIKRKIFKVHYHCHISYNKLCRHLLDKKYKYEEILQIVPIPGFRLEKFEEKIYKMPSADLYRFLLFKKNYSIQQIMEELINNDEFMKDMEKMKEEYNFSISQLDEIKTINGGIDATIKQIKSFISFIKRINRYNPYF